jgi:hypothetical protein
VSVRALTAALLAAVPVLLAASQPASVAQSVKNTAPESFKANGQITGAAGGAASEMVFQIDKYTSDADHAAMVKALKDGGNAAFLAALKKAPKIGTVTLGGRPTEIRWARTSPVDADHRRVVFVTDKPVYFAGAGAVDAKPTAGYDIAVVEFTIDSVGLGSGTMAPAAKVKPGGPSGVEVEDYSGKRITLMTVTRNLK